MHKVSIAAFVLGAAIIFNSISTRASEYDPASKALYTVDNVSRLLAVAGRKSVPCPDLTDKTAVLLIAGQSNAGNHAQANFTSAYPSRAVNLFAGKCYPMASPLLGTTGLNGESWTLLSDQLLAAGTFDRVVVVATGIGGSAIARWQAGADLNRMLIDVVKATTRKYRITHVLWHQGETDLYQKTTTEEYTAAFADLASSLRAEGVTAPLFVSVASKGAYFIDSWNEEDPITIAQRQLADAAKGIYAGPDTNVLVPPSDRYDRTHFARAGQEKVAREWARILREHATGVAQSQANSPVDAAVLIPSFELPASPYMSEESRKRLDEMLDAARAPTRVQNPAAEDSNSSCPNRARLDELHRSLIARARAAHAVDIEKQTIAGVDADIVTPKGGVPARNRNRVLINLHGGGYSCATRGGLAGQVEAIPIASVGQFKVIAVDYRTSPESRFPAATEDVAAVYRELLKSYRPQDIGIYGCSTGATLSATAVAWFQKEKLPRPGALGLFCSGATKDDLIEGDSYYLGLATMGRKVPAPNEPYPTQPYMRDARTDDPVAVPVSSLEGLSRFPPTLLISGTRDMGLSSVVYTDTRLAKAGVATELHIWEGMWHAFHFDPQLPESREAYDVIARFFDRQLGGDR